MCPILDESNVSGAGIFNANIDEVKKIMDEDPVVKEGSSFEIHACRSFARMRNQIKNMQAELSSTTRYVCS